MLVLSHDEVVHGKRSLLSKMPGDTWQQFANLRSLYAFQFTHPGKKMLFMGGEFGQWIEWNPSQALDWNLLDYEPHRQVKQLVADLNRLYRAEPSLHEVDFEWQGFEWIDFHDADSSVVAFLRRARDPSNHLVVVCNFTPVSRTGYRIGVPEPCFYREVLNTDDAKYGGSGVTNAPGRQAVPAPWQNQPCHHRDNLAASGRRYFQAGTLGCAEAPRTAEILRRPNERDCLRMTIRSGDALHPQDQPVNSLAYVSQIGFIAGRRARLWHSRCSQRPRRPCGPRASRYRLLPG